MSINKSENLKPKEKTEKIHAVSNKFTNRKRNKVGFFLTSGRF